MDNTKPVCSQAAAGPTPGSYARGFLISGSVLLIKDHLKSGYTLRALEYA